MVCLDGWVDLSIFDFFCCVFVFVLLLVFLCKLLFDGRGFDGFFLCSCDVSIVVSISLVLKFEVDLLLFRLNLGVIRIGLYYKFIFLRLYYIE